MVIPDKPGCEMRRDAITLLLSALLTAIGMQDSNGLMTDSGGPMCYLQVPFPRMHFLISSLAPLSAPKDVGKLAAPRTMDQVSLMNTAVLVV